MVSKSDEALAIAKNIMELAAKIQTGTVDSNTHIDYINYDYPFMLLILYPPHLSESSLPTDSELPNPAHVAEAAKILGKDAPKLDEVYNALKDHVRPYLLQYAWSKMEGNKFDSDATHYSHFHTIRENMGLPTYSPQLFDLLGVSEDEYTKVDKLNALDAITELFKHAMEGYYHALKPLEKEGQKLLENGQSLNSLREIFEGLTLETAEEISRTVGYIQTTSRLNPDEVRGCMALLAAQPPYLGRDGPPIH